MSSLVGIDLGTTHTVLARSKDGAAPIVLPLLQHTAPGEQSALEKLSSVLYLPAAAEGSDQDRGLPFFETPRPWFVGAYAHAQGAKVPGRQIVSAKSWLSYAGVDRTADILPWGGLDDVRRLSPVAVTAAILEHVKGAYRFATDEDLAAQDVVITVPASFDEVARRLTEQAAQQAGLSTFRLLEEPQAAVYALLSQPGQDPLAGHQLILVVDVGGGTTDLTLLSRDDHGQLSRIAVGEHLMLGGDNMDATLARVAEQELTGTVGSLTAARWAQLSQSARLAKESLLSAGGPDEMGVTLSGRGRSLLSGAKTATLSRARTEELVLDGFFPLTGPGEGVQHEARAALSTLGLPYERDAAISRHVCSFLQAHCAAAAARGAKTEHGLCVPDAVVLNGGVFKSARIRERLTQVFAGWFAKVPHVVSLDDAALDQAVALGAAHYAQVRRGQGTRIVSGAARGYFIDVDDDGTARALSVVPRGLHEGERVTVPRDFRLVLGRPVTFQVSQSSTAAPVEPGAFLPHDIPRAALPPVHTVLQPPDEVTVRLSAELTEVGTLALSLDVADASAFSWALDFSTRAAEQPATNTDTPSPTKADPLPDRMDEAKALVEAYYGNKGADVDPKSVKQLRRKLEKVLGPRDMWSLAVSRELCGSLIAGKKRRRRSPEHERAFFQLLGYTLRPGFGAPVDEWRMEEAFSLFAPGVQFVKEKPNWAAYWVMWRRIAGGLSKEQQEALLDQVRWYVTPKSMREGKAPKGPKCEGHDEMVRLCASLERLSAPVKQELGEAFWHHLEHKTIQSHWCIGRLGAREPLCGSAHDVVDVACAESWLERLLALKWKDTEGAAFAAAQIARRTDDRARDIGDELRQKVLRKLRDSRASSAWVDMVEQRVASQDATARELLGDALPIGLKLG